MKKRFLCAALCFVLVERAFGSSDLSDGSEGRDLRSPSALIRKQDPLSRNIAGAEKAIRTELTRSGVGVPRVLLLGITGSGKTTLAHALAGKKLSIGKDLCIEPASGQELLGFRVGHTAVSETLSPVGWFDRGARLVYWDCPGFMDTRGGSQEIVNAFAIDQLFESPAKIKLLLVLQESEVVNSRGTDMFERFDRLQNILPDPRELFQSVALVVTKIRGEESGSDLLKRVTGKDHPLLSFFRSREDLVFSLRSPRVGSEGSSYNLFDADRPRLIEVLSREPVFNPTHAVSLDPMAIFHLVNLEKDFDMEKHVSAFAGILQGFYQGANLETLKKWQSFFVTIDSAEDDVLDVPESLFHRIFNVGGFPRESGLEKFVDLISASWRFSNLLLKAQRGGGFATVLEPVRISQVLRPHLKAFRAEVDGLVKVGEIAEQERRRAESLAADLAEQRVEMAKQEEAHKRRVADVEKSAVEKRRELTEALRMAEMTRGRVDELQREIAGLDSKKAEEKKRLEREFVLQKSQLADSFKERLRVSEEQRQSYCRDAECARRALDEAGRETSRLRSALRDAQESIEGRIMDARREALASVEGRVESAKREERERVIAQVRRELMMQQQAMMFSGFGGPVYFG